MAFTPSNMTAIEAAKWRILLLGNLMLVVFIALAYMVILRNGNFQPWESYMYAATFAGVIANVLVLVFKPNTQDVVAYTTVGLVCFIVYARIFSLFAGGTFEQAPDKSIFISIFAYIPLIYMGVYVLHDARTGFRLSLMLWLFYVLVIGYFCWPIWQADPYREGLDHLLLYSFVAHPTALVFMALVPRYSAALAEATESLETSEKNRRAMEHAAMTDTLTGLRNRRFFDDRVADIWREGMATGCEVGLILVDIDHFKAYNDLSGHLQGDQCLRRVAKGLLSCVAEQRNIARFGGEEFVVLMPGASRQNMEQMLEALRDSIESMQLVHPDPKVGCVTVSAGGGVAYAHPEMQFRDLLSLADDALYIAKSKGRNCTFLAA